MRLHFFALCFLLLNGLTVSAWGGILRIGGTRVDLFMPAIAWLAICSRDTIGGLLVAAVVGTFYDLASGGAFGLYAFGVPALFLFLKYIVSNASMVFWWQRLFLVLVGSFVFNASMRSITGYIETVWPWGAFQAVLDGVVSLFMLPVLLEVTTYLEDVRDEKRNQ